MNQNRKHRGREITEKSNNGQKGVRELKGKDKEKE